MAFESEQPASAGSDPASEARAYLEAAGVRGITITGEGESWRVSVGWNEAERFVCAFSEKRADTPNDPLFLAQEALAALIRNEGPCPHAFHIEPALMEPPETDALWSPEEEAPDLGAELLEVQDEYDVTEGTISDDALAEALAEPPADQDHDAVAAEDASADVPPPERDPAVSPAYPGVAILPDDLSIALALVIEAVAAEEETRVAAVEALQAIDLQAMSDYGNWPAGVAMDANVEAGARRFMAFAQQRTAIQSHSLALRRSARDHRARGDLSALQAMSDGVAVGWP